MSELEEDLSGIASDALESALRRIISALSSDSEYAWAWHSTIALTLYDGGLDHRHANALAAALMIKLFDHDSTNNPRWRELFEPPVTP